jgi:hypothetical protein
MRSMIDKAVGAVIVLLVSVVLNTALEYAVRDSGAVMVGPALKIDGQDYAVVDLSNFTDQPLDELLLSVPISTDVSKIASSNPIQITEISGMVGAQDRRSLRLSGVEPNRVTRVVIAISNQAEAELVRVVNARQMNLVTAPTTGIERRIVSFVKEALLAAGISAVWYASIIW